MMLNAEHNSNLAPFILFLFSKTEFFLLVGIHLPSSPCGLEGFFAWRSGVSSMRSGARHQDALRQGLSSDVIRLKYYNCNKSGLD